MTKDLNVLLKVTHRSPDFSTVAGMKLRALALNAARIDLGDGASATRWLALLRESGLRRAGLSGEGIFKNQAADATIREMFFAGTIADWQVIVPDFGTIEGPFQIVALEFSADHAGEVTFDMSIESAGELAFLASEFANA
jgi:TP901-1 family phage major tail protein